MAELKLTPGTLRALELLNGTEGQVTLHDLNELTDEDSKVASAHLTSLIKNGLVEATDTEREVVRIQKVKAYNVTPEGIAYFQSLQNEKE